MALERGGNGETQVKGYKCPVIGSSENLIYSVVSIVNNTVLYNVYIIYWKLAKSES